MTELVDFSQNAPITHFLSGCFATVFAASGLIFIKYWTKTHDRFFLYFAISCFLISLERALRATEFVPSESASLLYLIRLAGLMVIIFAIASANMKRGKRD